MIGYIRNKPLPARRYLALLVLPWCVMLLLAVAVLWPYLARFRTTVEALQDVQLPGVLEAQRTRTNLNMLRKQLAIIYLAEAPLERRRARLPKPCWPAWSMTPHPWPVSSWTWARVSGSSTMSAWRRTGYFPGSTVTRWR